MFDLMSLSKNIREHNYAQRQFSGWEFSIESQTEDPEKNHCEYALVHYEYTLAEANTH